MKPYGFPKLDTCCKVCTKRSGLTKGWREKGGLGEKRRARQAGRAEIKRQTEAA